MCGPRESKPNLTHVPSIRNTDTSIWGNNLRASPERKRGFFFFYSSNKLSNKPLIPRILLPVGTLNIWFTIGWTKEKLLQLPLPSFFHDVNHVAAATRWFISLLQKEKNKKNQTHFLKGQTVYIHLLQGSIGHQAQRDSGKTLNEGFQSTKLFPHRSDWQVNMRSCKSPLNNILYFS